MPLISDPFIKSCVTGQFHLPGLAKNETPRRSLTLPAVGQGTPRTATNYCSAALTIRRAVSVNLLTSWPNVYNLM
jgi:hypothetical protein